MYGPPARRTGRRSPTLCAGRSSRTFTLRGRASDSPSPKPMGEPMVGWIIQAVRRGRLTTRFPRAAPTEEELPPTARLPVLAPLPSEASRLREALCPTEAIEGTSIDEGRCLRCARCLPAGALGQGPWDGPGPGASRGPGSAGRGVGAEPGPLGAAPFARSLHVFPIDVGSCQ